MALEANASRKHRKKMCTEKSDVQTMRPLRSNSVIPDSVLNQLPPTVSKAPKRKTKANVDAQQQHIQSINSFDNSTSNFNMAIEQETDSNEMLAKKRKIGQSTADGDFLEADELLNDKLSQCENFGNSNDSILVEVHMSQVNDDNVSTHNQTFYFLEFHWLQFHNDVYIDITGNFQ